MMDNTSINSTAQAPFAWPTTAAEYKLQKRIGNGAFSSVWKATCAPNTVDVAIKIMDLEQITTSFEDILQEVLTMRLCDNVHVLRCFCSFVQKDQLWLVTELMDRGSCLRVMNVARHCGFGEGMNEEWLAYILQEALQGLRYLHDNGQIHRDIKSGNILLDSRGNVRIADFGVSGWTLSRGQRLETVKTFVGTPCWMAPEVMEQLEGYDHRADIWSVGITALELAKGMAPYAKYPPMRVLVLTIEEDPPSLKSYDDDKQRTGAPFSRMFEDFVRKCLQKQPKARPSAEELLKHKFLKGRTKDALLHQLLDHLSAVGSGEEPDQNDDDSNFSGASFLRDAGSVSSKGGTGTPPDMDVHSVDSSCLPLQRVLTSLNMRQSHPGQDLPPEDERHRRGGSKVSFDTKSSDDKTLASEDGSADKYVSGASWVFESSSLPESGAFSHLGGVEASDGGAGSTKRGGRRKRTGDGCDDEEDLGDFLDGFENETATLKSTAKEGGYRAGGCASDGRKSQEEEQDHRYNIPRQGSLVLMEAASSLSSRGGDDIVNDLLGGGGEERGPSRLLGAAKENVFDFDDSVASSEQEPSCAGGEMALPPAPLLRTMDNKMVSSVRGNAALERLLGSGMYRQRSDSAGGSSSKGSWASRDEEGEGQGESSSRGEDDEEEDMDVFLDGFEEETADMNF